MLLQQEQQLLKYPPSPTHQRLQHWRRAMQPAVLSRSAGFVGSWRGGGRGSGGQGSRHCKGGGHELPRVAPTSKEAPHERPWPPLGGHRAPLTPQRGARGARGGPPLVFVWVDLVPLEPTNLINSKEIRAKYSVARALLRCPPTNTHPPRKCI